MDSRVVELVHPEIDFRAMTPRRFWGPGGPDEIIGVLCEWFGEEDLIESMELLDVDRFADREGVGYRLRVTCPDGQYLVEQQAYLSERDGRIGWLRIMCSGFRPTDPRA